ncbi:MAG: M3 family metallopeptidase [Halioglobus sp.]
MTATSNPFFHEPPAHGLPDFDAITTAHYRQAFDRGLAEHRQDIAVISESAELPDFANTVEAMERAGCLLDRVSSVFFNLTSSNTNDEIQALELSLSAELATHHSVIYTNPQLYTRIESLHAEREPLDPDQRQLLQEIHQDFVHAGAALNESGREEMRQINESLASLTTRFSQNVLKDTNAFELVLESEEDLAGLPELERKAARSEAEQRGKPGKYVVTISRSSITPFLQFADRRDLREQMFKAYTSCGKRSVDNQPLLKEIVSLRQQRAQLLGYDTHADFMLSDRMAGTPDAVLGLLDQIWQPTKIKVAAEAAVLQERVRREGESFKLAPWDWWYYAEKERAEKFSLDPGQIKPYFKLENVRDGAFAVVKRLYGISVTPRNDVPVYHRDVTAYDVTDADGSPLGLFLVDYFMRPSKRGGAWMSNFREQSNLDGAIRPIVVNCCNFPKGEPCLLGMDEVRTLFHEFGHALHSLLSQVRYRSLAGTNVKQDFVELPSQIMEHWAVQPEVLKSYARHVDTGEPIPDELIDKLKASATFNQGFATTEYLAASYLDMAWHSQAGLEADEVDVFESDVMNQIGLIDAVLPRYKSTYFQHIFTGDSYSAGYYSYIWAEVLDADGFEAFEENGIFDQATALSFRKNVLEMGGSDDPMSLYKAFRGREPQVAPLLAKRGLAL